MAFTIHYQLDNATLYPIALKNQPFKSPFLQRLFFGYQYLFKKTMPIKAKPINIADYDTVIIGTPFWSGQVPVPIKTFLNQHYLEGKTVAIFTSSKWTKSNFLKQMKTLIPESPIVAKLALVNLNNKITPEHKNKIARFVNVITHHFKGNQSLSTN